MPIVVDLPRAEPASRRDNPAPFAPGTRPRKVGLVLGGTMLCLIFSASVVALVLNPAPAPQFTPKGPILVVGDSLVMQTTNALRSWAIPSVRIVADGGSGSAPCDWEKGYTDPYTGRYEKFSQLLQTIRPAAVVLAFTGNPGLGSIARGCVNASVHYTLSALLASYKRALTQMADEASAHGARVYFSASPPRNPATPAGAYTDGAKDPEYGFNGVPALNALYEALANSGRGQELHWTFDPYAAQYVSTSSLTWQLTERCLPWDGSMCLNGSVQVRAGGFDAIHLDADGAGEALYAIGLVKMPLEQMTGFSTPSPVASGLGR